MQVPGSTYGARGVSRTFTGSSAKICGWVVALCISGTLFGCSKKKSSDDDESSNSGAVVAAGQPTANKGVLSDTGGITLPASLSGVPANPSNDATLAVTIEGNSLKNYRYALLSDAATCNGATYSDPQPIATPIADAIGHDGAKLLCVLVTGEDADGSAKLASLSHAWFKDTTGPTIAIGSFSGIGPNSTFGPKTAITATASDGASGLASVKISIRKGNGACLNSTGTAFNSTCPNLVAASDEPYAVMVADTAFTAGQSYTISARATDLAGNVKDAAPKTLTWDTTPPATPGSLTVTTDLDALALTWTASAGASSYIVVRKAFSQVDTAPVAGDTAGTSLGNDNIVAATTGTTSMNDAGLTPFTRYYYKVFAVDSAGNVSSGVSGTGVPDAAPRFQGLNYAYVWGPERRVAAEWQPFAPGGNLASMSYDVFSATAAGGQSFTSAADYSVDALSRALYADTGDGDNLFMVVRSRTSANVQDGNTRELKVRLAPGTHHKLTTSGRHYEANPLTQTFLRMAWAVDVDPWGNTLFSGGFGVVHVLCQETDDAYYCKGRTRGKVYTIAGTDGVDDGADGALATATPMGQIVGLDVDAHGNVFIADQTYFRVRAICYNPVAAGFCQAKTVGHVYHFAGTGSTGDGNDDAVAKTTTIGLPHSLALDSYGNLFVGDSSYRRIRAICQGTSGYCQGKTPGNIYNVAGTGTLGDGADAQPALVGAIGEPRSIAFDGQNNLYIADWDYRRVRVLCQSTTAGVCTGKTSGYVYRLMGTGVAGDGGDNSVAASTTMGQSYGLIATSRGNVYLTDSTYFRVRSLCYVPTEAGFCFGKTTGNTYWIAGTGAGTDGASGGLALTTAIGGPRGLALDGAGNMIVADDTMKRLRLICKNPANDNACQGQFADYHYYLVGGGAGTIGWQTNALDTPVGTPQGVAIDSLGNVFFGDSTGRIIRAICYDVSSGFCAGKTLGSSYFVAGTGVAGDGVDNALALATAIGVPTALAVDSHDNLYISDSTYRRIRVVCFDTTSPGFCNGKTAGNMYRFAGNGTSADSADNVVAATATMGAPNDLDLDAYDNVYIADSAFWRIRVVCRSTSGICAGRTIGNMYRFAGTGANGDGANGGATGSTATGPVNNVAVDAFGNVFFSDGGFFRVRLACLSTSGACTGKNSGSVYRILGTGVTGDGAAGAATTSAIGAAFGLDTDSLGNLYVADSTYRRIRVVCYNTSAGYCDGLAADTVYRAYGNGGAITDMASGTSIASTRLDTPARDAIELTPNADVLYAGSTGSMRMFIGPPQ